MEIKALSKVAVDNYFTSSDGVFRDFNIKGNTNGRDRLPTAGCGLLLPSPTYSNRSKSESNIVETRSERQIYQCDVSTTSLRRKRSSYRRRGLVGRSRLFLMGGIVTSPLVPRKRATDIPLSMHADDYKYMMQNRSREWSVPSLSSGSDASLNFKRGGKHACAYLNEAMCHACCMDKKHQVFVSKLGKLFLLTEYETEENRIKITLAQYGNTHISGYKKCTKPKIKVHISVLSEKRRIGRKVIKLDGSRRNEEFKFNYLSYFAIGTEERAREAVVEVKLLHKKAFYRCWKVVKRESMPLEKIQIDPEEPDEIQFY